MSCCFIVSTHQARVRAFQFGLGDVPAGSGATRSIGILVNFAIDWPAASRIAN